MFNNLKNISLKRIVFITIRRSARGFKSKQRALSAILEAAAKLYFSFNSLEFIFYENTKILKGNERDWGKMMEHFFSI